MTSIGNIVSRWRPSHFIRIFGLILALSLLVGAGAFIGYRYQGILDDARRDAANFSFALAQEMERSFQTVDMVLGAVIEEIRNAGVDRPEDYEPSMHTEAVNRMLRTRMSGVPMLDAITLVRSDGKLINFSRYWPIPDVNIADRDYFSALKDDPTRDRFISEPVKNRGTGTWTIYLARRVSAADGSFIGLVLGAIELRYFEAFYQKIQLGAGSLISLYRRDGMVLVRYPNAPDAIGQSVANSPIFQRLKSADRAVVENIGTVDQVDRIRAATVVKEFPLVLSVAHARETVLAPWRQMAIAVGSVTGVAAIALLLLTFRIAALIDHREQDANERAFAARIADIAAHFPGVIYRRVQMPDGAVHYPFFSDTSRLFKDMSREETQDGNLLEQALSRLTPESRAAWQEAVSRTARTGTPLSTELKLRNPDGSRRWVRTLATTRRAPDGTVTWDGVALDVTEVQIARERAEHANRAKTRFLAAASHDMRQPVQSLFLFADALYRHVNTSRGREILGNLQASLNALRGILDGMLDISKLDAGLIVPAMRDVALSELIDTVAATYADRARARNLNWSVEICPVLVRTDPELFGRMLRNIVENAIKFTEFGSVGIFAGTIGNTVTIEVRDTGIGIKPEHTAEIFAEFHQINNPERNREQGLGLGLAIVRRLSHLLGHEVSVRSAPGQGSVFTIALPLIHGEAPSVVPEANSLVANQTRRTIIVVEDDAIVRLGLQVMLEEAGFSVVGAASTAQALAELQRQRCQPDLIIADYRLCNDETGIETILEIRSHCRASLPAVLLTGEIAPDVLATSAPDLIVVNKPIGAADLQRILAERLRSAA